MALPISEETIKKHAYLPVKLAELSKYDEAAAIRILRYWGEGKKTINALWNEIHEELSKHDVE